MSFDVQNGVTGAINGVQPEPPVQPNPTSKEEE